MSSRRFSEPTFERRSPTPHPCRRYLRLIDPPSRVWFHVLDQGVCMGAHIAHNVLERVHDFVPSEPLAHGGRLRPRSISQAPESVPADTLIGASHAWRAVLKRASQVAATEATTCLQGESGTGKEVVARFIHGTSPRSRGPFVAINCAALPEALLESELFGFERGAFTGAEHSKPGHIEMAA